MKLKTIKGKQSDTHYTKYVFKALDLIKNKCQIPQSAVMFFLGYFHFGQVFLCNGIIYVAKTSMEYTETREPIVETMVLTELYKVDTNTFEITTVLGDKVLSSETLTDWLEQPCDLNYEIDYTYSEVIKYLNNYSNETFKTYRYLFYSKKDNDYNFINNIYAYDTKNQAEIKLYIPNIWSDKEQIYIPPRELKDITAEDLSGRLSVYQQRQCKKAFLKLANDENSFFKTKNYWVMELVKLAIQPVLVLHEWSCHRCFSKPKLFGHIWVYDFPSVDEEPSFFITDEYFTKVAVLKFKKPEYLFKGIYKREMAKAACWQLNEKEIKELMEFLQSPSNRGADYGNGRFYDGYQKYVKTNWQQLIFEYNHNTAYWDIDEPISNKVEGEIEQLPFDLPMPDYTELLNDKW